MRGDRAAVVRKTLLTALTGNLVSAGLKLVFGLLANSIGMLADAFHSIFDAGSSVIGLYGNKVGAKPPDSEHPYGHTKFEYIAALGITTMMFVTGFNVVREALDRVSLTILPTITLFSVFSMGVSMSISGTIALYEKTVGKRTASAILVTDAYHSATDVIASIVVVAGFVGLQAGVRYADSVAAIIVSLLISHVAISLFKRTANVLADQGISPQLTKQIQNIASTVRRGVSCHAVRGRVIGEGIFLDMHLSVEADLSVKEAHDISEEIERRLRKAIKEIQEVIIHVEPTDLGKTKP